MSSSLEAMIRSQDDMVTMLYELTVPTVHSVFGAMYKAFKDAYDNDEDVDRDLKHSISRVSKWTSHDVRGVAAAYEAAIEDEVLRLTYSIVRCSAYIKHATGITSTPDIDFQTSFPDVLHCILIYASRAITLGDNIRCLKDDGALEETTTILRDKRVIENALTSLSKNCIMAVMHKNGETASQQLRSRNEDQKELERIRRTARKEEEERVEAEERAKIRAKAKARERAEAQEAEEAEAVFQENRRARAQRAKERAEAQAAFEAEEARIRDEQFAQQQRLQDEKRAKAMQEAELARQQAEEELRVWKQGAEEAKLQAEKARLEAEEVRSQVAPQQQQLQRSSSEGEVRKISVPLSRGEESPATSTTFEADDDHKRVVIPVRDVEDVESSSAAVDLGQAEEDAQSSTDNEDDEVVEEDADDNAADDHESIMEKMRQRMEDL
jgi:hypothetical protein